MVQLSYLFASLVTLSAAWAKPAHTKRTVAQVQSDIATISTQVTTLNSAISAFPTTGGTLLQALTIHNGATALITSVNTATTDTGNTAAFSEADGTTILTSVQAIQPTIISALTGIATKHDALAALPIGGIPALVLQDLRTLNTSTSAFADALILKSPADLVATGTNIKNTLVAAFNTAIAAYD